MHPLSSDEAFNWITEGRLEIQEPATGGAFEVRVRNLIPPVFSRYVKVLHWLDGHYENIDDPLTPAEIAILGIPDCGNIASLVESKRRVGESRLLWREFAGLLEVPFAQEINPEWFRERLRPHPECWPRFIYGPADGTLNSKEIRELSTILRTFRASDEFYFRFAAMPFITTNTPLLFSGKLEELEQFMEKRRYQFSPEYWWPSDHSWCVCSDYDLLLLLLEAIMRSLNRYCIARSLSRWKSDRQPE